MNITPRQEQVIRRSRRVLENPQAVIPDDYADNDINGRNAFLIGYLQSLLKTLLEVAEELAGVDDAEGSGH